MLLNWTNKYSHWVISLGNSFSCFYVLIVFISVYEVFMRYVFNAPTSWVHETSIAFASFLTMYGGIYSYALNKHICVPVIVEKFSPPVQLGFRIFSEFITGLFLLLLSISSFSIAQKAVFTPHDGIRLETTGSSWNSPSPGILKISMFVIMVFFTVLVLSRFVVLVIALIQKNYGRVEKIYSSGN